ncbi:MAG: hypothetical protein H7249_05670 [Chitinophagaceae bacterium]|nr:hypothetical protein [Oligoflexus sp.]
MQIPLQARLLRLLPPVIIMVGASSLLSCKKQDESLLSVTTALGGTNVDLTSYTTTDPAVYKLFAQEVSVSSLINSYFAVHADVTKGKIQKKGSMTDAEIEALRLYTTKGYIPVNLALRTKDPRNLPNMVGIVKVTASGLNKIPTKACIVYRGVTSSARQIALTDDFLKVGRYSEKSFLSTSLSKSAATDFAKNGGYLWIIKSSQCHDITWLSQYKYEKEVLFAPGSEFIVNPKVVVRGPLKTIYMTHVAPAAKKKSGFRAILTGKARNIIESITGAEKAFPPLTRDADQSKATSLLDATNLSLARSEVDDNSDELTNLDSEESANFLAVPEL